MTSCRLPLVLVLIGVLIIGMFITGCTTTQEAPRGTLIMATTTSLYDTGLLDYLRTDFEKEYNVDVRITSQGTGKAIELAKNGDVDILLVHDPAREKAFMDEGFGQNRRCFAYNYFIIVGPSADPAGIRGMTPEAAFAQIITRGKNATPGVAFVSRGDASGTHSKEQAIWKAAGYNYSASVQKSGPWYIEAGKGMGETLTMASEKGAYTLTDEGTYLAFTGNLQLEPVISEGDILLNVYSALSINPAKYPGQNVTLANNWISYLQRDTTQRKIADYGKDKYGKGLFSPLQGDTCTQFKCDCTRL